MISYYVDPGTGFVFAQNAALIWALLAGAAGGVLVAFRFFFRFFKWLLLLAAVIAAILMGGHLINRQNNQFRAFILAIDAMDPAMTEQLMDAGKLPNLAALRQSGSYSRLATTVPAETVVAFTSMATGVNPGKHGIFDFIMRDPRDCMPFLSLNEISNTPAGVRIANRRRAPAFWEVFSRRGIPSRVFFFPNTFPPDRIRTGVMLSGMGVPDITGTMGRFTYYSLEGPGPREEESRGRHVRLESKDGVLIGAIFGPKVMRGKAVKETQATFSVVSTDKADEMQLRIGGRRCVLRRGQWSDWQRVEFGTGFLQKARGMVRFYLASAGNALGLYATPVHFDPENPPFPVSWPRRYSATVVRRDGLYPTLGMPADTWGLQEGKLHENAFLEQVDQVLESRLRIVRSEMKKQTPGVLCFYFDTLDIVQHMFYRYSDPSHPAFRDDERYRGVIAAYYERIDAIVGEVVREAGADAAVFVVSDHGFSPFRKQVHLNRWLQQNGFLALEDGCAESAGLFEGVDWARTKAYAAGFGGIYVNTIGREFRGIVPKALVPAVTQDLRRRLAEFKDPVDGQDIVRSTYAASEVYQGPWVKDAPDIYAGFSPGYRASWQTALGGVPAGLVDENARTWSGDHLVDPQSVPGVFFSSRRTRRNDPSILDIAPSLYGLFGFQEPGLDGKDVF